MEEIGATILEYHASIASLMVPIRAPMHTRKPSPWHPFTRLQNKYYLHCMKNHSLEVR